MIPPPKNWGATPGEIAAAYPCDELGFAHDETFFRAIDVAAPPALVFRWLCQLRRAPYSYDWLDNFGRRSPPRLIDGLDALAPGQRVMIIFRIVRFSATSITIRLASRPGRALMGDFAGSYLVVPTARGCRIVAKILVLYPKSNYGRLLRVLLPQADLIMFRKQLITLRTYAERDARAGRSGPEATNPLVPRR